MISTKSGKLNHSRKFEKMRPRKFLKRLQNKCNPLCANGDGKSRSFMNFGIILICSPANPSLLGLNVGGGAEVKLRLRRPNNELDFLPYNQILDTMLHELCHNEYGPHNSDFYNLLDEIRKECEELMAKGITGTGQGFDLPGKRLGGFSRQPPLSSLRQSALAAAENRMKRESLLPSGPKRIGGDSSIKAALSPIQAAAMAAERRMHDDLWCGSKSTENEGFPETSNASILADMGSIKTSIPPIVSRGREDAQAVWQCGTCTLSNQSLALICEACGIPKHEGHGVKKLNVWSCKFCTLNNGVEVERCLACGEWRYSHGAPTSTRGPYLGT